MCIRDRRSADAAATRVLNEVADHANSGSRELAREEAGNQLNLRSGVAELAAEHELELVVAVDRRGGGEELVSEQWLGNGLGAKAELLDTCNELAGVRPRLLYRGGEHLSLIHI